MARRIGVVSVGRSDRGHLAPLLALLPEHMLIEHSSDAEIQAAVDVGLVMGEAVGDFTRALHDQKPDLLVIFGDRWEQFAAATAAHILGIPIVHLHAGETTEAVYDDGFRNAISALATHHVAAAEPYAERLRAQGYRSVHCLGAPGLSRLKAHTGAQHKYPVILVQFHPETRNVADISRQVDELQAALDTFDNNAYVYVTEPGMDAGRQAIIDGLRYPRFHFTDDEWIDKLASASVLVGNSSCGIIETPSIPLPSVNIGDRQKGRLMADSVIQAEHDRDDIHGAIIEALHMGKSLRHVENPHGDRGAAKRIAEFLRTCAL